MAYRWSKEDKFHYDKSEVMKELEKRVIETVKRAEILQQKIAQETKPEDVDRLTQSYQGLAKAREEAGFAEDDEVAEDAVELTEDDLQDEIVSDLRDLVQAAIKENNVKLAYKIERTIDEILEQDVRCG